MIRTAVQPLKEVQGPGRPAQGRLVAGPAISPRSVRCLGQAVILGAEAAWGRSSARTSSNRMQALHGATAARFVAPLAQLRCTLQASPQVVEGLGYISCLAGSG